MKIILLILAVVFVLVLASLNPVIGLLAAIAIILLIV